jgi:TetR/AcrR family transcriptional repressor of nem operon
VARHKEFDPDVALDRAMKLFWEKGYEQTSMQDLVEGMGIHKRSMYDTFGDKHSLYLKALHRYGDTVAEPHREAVESQKNPREALRLLLGSVIANFDLDPKGCLAVNSATEVALRDSEAAGWVRQNFETWRQLIADLIQQGQRSGEFSAKVDPQSLADSLFNVWVGLRVQARAGASRERLAEMIDNAMAVLR